MANEEIQKYIKECREKNFSDDVIRSELLKVGWPEADITEAFDFQLDSVFLQSSRPRDIIIKESDDQEDEKPPSKKWLKVLIIAITTLFILAGSASAYYFFFIHKRTPNSMEAQKISNETAATESQKTIVEKMTNLGWKKESIKSEEFLEFGGAWSTMYSMLAPNENSLFMIYQDFLDSELRFAKSNDGGKTWKISTIGKSRIYSSFVAIDENNIYVIYQGEDYSLKLAKSEDGGQNWKISVVPAQVEPESFGSSAAWANTSIAAPDVNHIYLAYKSAGKGFVKFIKSVDGGENWQEITVDPTEDISKNVSISAPDINKIFLTYHYEYPQEGLTFAKSEDGGTNWKITTVASADIHNEVRAESTSVPDQNTIFICYNQANSLKLAKSIDGGASWILSDIDSSEWLSFNPVIQSIGKENIFTISADKGGVINFLVSFDGGQNWQKKIIDPAAASNFSERGGVTEYDFISQAYLTINKLGDVFILFDSNKSLEFRFIYSTNNPDDKIEGPKKLSSCSEESFAGLDKPLNSGTSKERITSTMKLFVQALEEGNECLATSLFVERAKYSEVMGAMFQSGQNKMMANDLKKYTISTSADEKNIFGNKATAITEEDGKKVAYDIYFVQVESGEYLIWQM